MITACAENRDIHTDPGNSTALVVYHPPTATDNSGEVTVTCDPPSSSEFLIGRTNVTCIAQDISGNNVTCEFHVDVKGMLVKLFSF